MSSTQYSKQKKETNFMKVTLKNHPDLGSYDFLGIRTKADKTNSIYGLNNTTANLCEQFISSVAF